MRAVFFLATAAAFAQLPVLDLTEPILVTEQRFETPLGQVAIWDDRTPLPFHQRLVPGEVPLLPGPGLLVPASSVAAMADGAALARSLSHTLAHVELRHTETLVSGLRIKVYSPHIPDKYSPTLVDFQVEAAAVKLGEEIFQSTECAKGSCAAFDDALAKIKEALVASP